VHWRSAADLPPGAVLINSPYDPEARFSVKRDITWTGYKAQCDSFARNQPALAGG
jgi:hypothetical protein